MPPRRAKQYDPQSEDRQRSTPPVTGGSIHEQAQQRSNRGRSRSTEASDAQHQQSDWEQAMRRRQSLPLVPSNSPTDSPAASTPFNALSRDYNGAVAFGMLNAPPSSGQPWQAQAQAQAQSDNTGETAEAMEDTEMTDMIVHPTHSNEAQEATLSKGMENMDLDSETRGRR